MKRLLCLILMYGSLSLAENTQILKCRVANSDWNSTFILDAVGSGFLKLSKSGDATPYTCSLKLDFISDGQRDVSPNVTVEFSRGVCDPELAAEIDQEVLSKFTLMINLTNKTKPKGRVQWLRSKQPDNCAVDKISMFDISHNTKKWQQGNWGRSTASELKKKSSKSK